MQIFKYLLISATLFLCSIGVSHAEYSADSIIQKNLEAKGGAKQWDKIETISLKGIMKMNGIEFPFEMIKKRPNKIFTAFKMQGIQGKQVYNGKIGWMVMPFLGKPEPEEMADDQLKDFKKQADIDGPLKNYKAKGNTIEYIGGSDMEGTSVVELKVTEKDGDVSSIFFDTESMLEIKTHSKVVRMGTTMEVSTTIGDYKNIDGILFPHSSTTSMSGSIGGQEVLINSVIINAEVDDAIFNMPVTQPTKESNKIKP